MSELKLRFSEEFLKTKRNVIELQHTILGKSTLTITEIIVDKTLPNQFKMIGKYEYKEEHEDGKIYTIVESDWEMAIKFADCYKDIIQRATENTPAEEVFYIYELGWLCEVIDTKIDGEVILTFTDQAKIRGDNVADLFEAGKFVAYYLIVEADGNGKLIYRNFEAYGEYTDLEENTRETTLNITLVDDADRFLPDEITIYTPAELLFNLGWEEYYIW